MRDRIKELRRVPAAELVPHPLNWRTHPDSQRTVLSGVLEEIGIADAVIAYEMEDGRLQLIDGHLRADELAGETIPVLILDVTAEEAGKLLLTLDPISALAAGDADVLDRLSRDAQWSDEAVSRMIDDLRKDCDQIISDADESPALSKSAAESVPQAIQMQPGKDYVVIMADDDDDWTFLKTVLSLRQVRRGGYKAGSAFDAIGTERVVPVRRLRELIDSRSINVEAGQGRIMEDPTSDTVEGGIKRRGSKRGVD